MTQYVDNEIKNPQVDDDEPNDVEEDGDYWEWSYSKLICGSSFNPGLIRTF